MKKLLFADDEESIRLLYKEEFEEQGYEVILAADGHEALKMFSLHAPDLLVIDIKMPGMDGIELLNYIKKKDPTISVIMISGHADTPVVVQAVQGGADDFIVKPFDVEMVEICIQKVLEKKDLKQRVKRLETELARQTLWEHFIGESPQFYRIRELIEQIGTTDLNVLIRGESGTGKDVVARLIHQMSDRSRGPFVKVNCAALPSELLESELFGHERGAFTGAYKSKPGRFELADKGTIFLDEIGEMSAGIQAKLLQVIENKEFFRVGGTQNVKVNVRLICATHVDIEQHIQSKEFRLDLFYRINDITLVMPPLRERIEDIPLLADHFTRRYEEKFTKEHHLLTPEAERALLAYPWPGNIRELESLMKRVVIFGEQEILRHIDTHRDERMPEGSGNGSGAIDAAGGFDPARLADRFFEGKTLKEISESVLGPIESRAIQHVLDACGWNRKKAAKELGISYRCLLYKIQQYELKQ
jgi:two-component system response regulator AtoC